MCSCIIPNLAGKDSSPPYDETTSEAHLEAHLRTYSIITAAQVDTRVQL